MRNKKHSIPEDKWRQAYYFPKVSRAHIEDITIKAINRACFIADKYKRIGFAWSGGKDSLVFYDVLLRSGVEIYGGVFVEYYNEYPAFMKWVSKNKPYGLQVVGPVGYSLDFLQIHGRFLFPEFTDTEAITSVYKFRWKEQAEFCFKHTIDLMVTGRRIDDGNNCGSKASMYVTSNLKTADKLNLIADWSWEETLAYLQYNNIELPPTYFYDRGFQLGTHQWPERGRLGPFPFVENWKALWDIDPAIVRLASTRLPCAALFMRGLK